MKNYLPLALATAAIVATQIVHAQGGVTGEGIRKTITDAGQRCDRVVNAMPGKILDNRDMLVVVTCSDGSRHVIRITPANQSAYYAQCRSDNCGDG